MKENSRIIKLGPHEYLVVDLTIPLRLDQEGYPGDTPPSRTLISDISKEGWHHYIHHLSDHCFHPHADAPNHFLANAQDSGFEVFGIAWSFHKACLVDLSESPEAREIDGVRFLTEIRSDHLAPYSKIIAEREAVVIRTGYDRWVESNRIHDPLLIPFLTEDAASFLASFDHLRIAGIDSLTVDAFGKQVSHLALQKTLIVESLVHLYDIPPEDHMDFDLQTSPVRIVGATGGPVIAYAYIAR